MGIEDYAAAAIRLLRVGGAAWVAAVVVRAIRRHEERVRSGAPVNRCFAVTLLASLVFSLGYVLQTCGWWIVVGADVTPRAALMLLGATAVDGCAMLALLSFLEGLRE